MPITSVPSRDLIDEYLEKLLVLQYKASEMIVHKLTRGELREKFLMNIVREEFPKITLSDGIISKGRWQSSQGDFFRLTDNARVGTMKVYDANDCMLFMEIKSKAKKNEFVQMEKHASEIKQKNCKICVGMFCYSTVAMQETVLKQFGFKYDSSIMGYNGYDSRIDEYPNIDFIYSLGVIGKDDNRSYFVIKDISENKTLYQDFPVIKYFFNMFR